MCISHFVVNSVIEISYILGAGHRRFRIFHAWSKYLLVFPLVMVGPGTVAPVLQYDTVMLRNFPRPPGRGRPAPRALKPRLRYKLDHGVVGEVYYVGLPLSACRR